MLFSSLQDEPAAWPDLVRTIAEIISTLILFLQLRIADEFKDFDIDSRYRPHRAVPRGLVSLIELRGIALAGAAMQFLIAVTIDVGLVPILFLVWAWIGLMTKEFFVRDWLVAHPVAYLLSHMLVMPLIAFYVSAFDWLCDCRGMPDGLSAVLALSFCCGLVLEIGRKIKAPQDEREGVETYSALWSRPVALRVWMTAAVAATATCSVVATTLGEPRGLEWLALAALSIAALTAVRFQRLVESSSGLIVLLLYLAIGPLQALPV